MVFGSALKGTLHGEFPERNLNAVRQKERRGTAGTKTFHHRDTENTKLRKDGETGFLICGTRLTGLSLHITISTA
jgi:hypothetical protein